MSEACYVLVIDIGDGNSFDRDKKDVKYIRAIDFNKKPDRMIDYTFDKSEALRFESIKEANKLKSKALQMLKRRMNKFRDTRNYIVTTRCIMISQSLNWAETEVLAR